MMNGLFYRYFNYRETIKALNINILIRGDNHAINIFEIFGGNGIFNARSPIGFNFNIDI